MEAGLSSLMPRVPERDYEEPVNGEPWPECCGELMQGRLNGSFICLECESIYTIPRYKGEEPDIEDTFEDETS